MQSTRFNLGQPQCFTSTKCSNQKFDPHHHVFRNAHWHLQLKIYSRKRTLQESTASTRCRGFYHAPYVKALIAARVHLLGSFASSYTASSSEIDGRTKKLIESYLQYIRLSPFATSECYWESEVVGVNLLCLLQAPKKFVMIQWSPRFCIFMRTWQDLVPFKW